MKTKIVLAAILTMLFAAMAFGQKDAAAVSKMDSKVADYSGTWNMDVNKSKLDDRARVESMTMTVLQTDKELKIESSVKRAERTDNGGSDQMRRGGLPNGGGMGGGMRRGGGFGGDGTVVYTLDGKETVNDLTASAAGKFTYQAKTEKDGKLKLVQTREFESPMGKVSVKTTEMWSLSTDGKTLTVKRDMETPRGTNSSEMIFTKQ
ncbi:MAG: hypothetical protein ABIP06_09610 [Pyrinomonadaceae bacterium]